MVKFHSKFLSCPRNLYKFQGLILFLMIFQFFHVKTFAAPYPGMGSSTLQSPLRGVLFNRKGFILQTHQTQWKLEKNSPSSSYQSIQDLSVRYVNPEKSGTLAIKTETLPGVLTLDSYTKKWIRDYSAYGFDVLGSKGFTQNKAVGFVVDLYHPRQNKQIRQVIFLKDKTAVIMTCSDDKDTFKETLNSCNTIMKTFSWL